MTRDVTKYEMKKMIQVNVLGGMREWLQKGCHIHLARYHCLCSKYLWLWCTHVDLPILNIKPVHTMLQCPCMSVKADELKSACLTACLCCLMHWLWSSNVIDIHSHYNIILTSPLPPGPHWLLLVVAVQQHGHDPLGWLYAVPSFHPVIETYAVS